MTPAEVQSMINREKPRRRRENMWKITNDNGFIGGASPFDNSSPFENKSFLRKKNPFGL